MTPVSIVTVDGKEVCSRRTNVLMGVKFLMTAAISRALRSRVGAILHGPPLAFLWDLPRDRKEIHYFNELRLSGPKEVERHDLCFT